MKINCVIIDDEPLARKGLKEYISDIEFLHLIAEFDNPLPAAPLIEKGEVKLLFMDIQMPKITGIDFFKTLHHPPPVVFTTAYPQYALEGFEVNALDYLVKPIAFERFLKAAQKAKEFYEIRNTNETEARNGEYFFIKADNKLVRISYDDMLFAEALQNYVLIHTTAKKYMTYLTFKAVEEYLPSDCFIKVHKSYIISAAKIDAIDGNIIQIGNAQIPVSRTLKDDVMEKLLKGKFLKR